MSAKKVLTHPCTNTKLQFLSHTTNKHTRKHTHTHTQTGKQASKHASKHTSKQANKQTGRQPHCHTSRQTGQPDNQTTRQPGRQTDRLTDRLTDNQTTKQPNKQTTKRPNNQTRQLLCVCVLDPRGQIRDFLDTCSTSGIASRSSAVESLVFSCSPRHAKSFVVSRGFHWYLVRSHDWAICACSPYESFSGSNIWGDR